MAFNIPGTDIVFGTSQAAKTLINIGGSLAHLLNPLSFIGGIFGFGNEPDEDNSGKREVQDNANAMRAAMDEWVGALGQSIEGVNYLQVNDPFGAIYQGRPIREYLDGTAIANYYDTLYGDHRSERAHAWLADRLKGIPDKFVEINDNFTEYTYNIANAEYQEAFPTQSQRLPFNDYSVLVKDGITSEVGQQLVDVGFSGNQVADINEGAIEIGGQTFKTTEQQRLDNTESIKQLQLDLRTTQDSLQQLQDQYSALLNDNTATQEELDAIETEFNTLQQESEARQAELDVLTQESEARQAQIDVLQQQEADREQSILDKQAEEEQFLVDNPDLPDDFFSLSQTERDELLFLTQSDEFLNAEAEKVKLVTAQQEYQAVQADENSTSEQKAEAKNNLNLGIQGFLTSTAALGGQFFLKSLDSPVVNNAADALNEDLDIKIRPKENLNLKLSPDFNTAGLLSGSALQRQPIQTQLLGLSETSLNIPERRMVPGGFEVENEVQGKQQLGLGRNFDTLFRNKRRGLLAGFNV